MQVVPIILAGGVGSRLWPYSRPDYPKPFIELPIGKSLFSRTISRAVSLNNVKDLVVVSNVKFAHLVRAELKDAGLLENAHCLWEPEGKNTAAAVLVAAEYVKKRFGDAVLLVLAADHLIDNTNVFSEAVDEAVSLAEENNIVTFGIEPTRVETGYGYIEHAGNEVVCFIEKPNHEKAKGLIEKGNVLWNSGMFCFKASTVLQEATKYVPELSKKVALLGRFEEGSDVHFSLESYRELESEPIDTAIMEKTKCLKVVPCDIGWDDIGSWTSFEKLCPEKDTKFNNSIKGNVVCINANNNLVLGSDRLIAMVGVEDLVVVSTEGSTLITNKSNVQQVKHLAQNEAVLNNPYARTQRPWGSYQVIDQGPGYKVKRIEVLPGAMLSLQVHQHRDEHWTVVCGEAFVTRGEEILKINANESVFIPKQEKHRIHNRAKSVCVLIEVQSGCYLGEDDIIRLEDIYKRV